MTTNRVQAALERRRANAAGPPHPPRPNPAAHKRAALRDARGS